MKASNQQLSCQAIKKNGERCKVNRGLAQVRDNRKEWKTAYLCGSHWKNSPEKVVKD